MLPLLIVAALATAAPSPAPILSSETVVIVTSRSTNTVGYRIVVSPDGGADLTTQAGVQNHGRIDASLTKRLYDDLLQAGALDALPAGRCMKSTSFGTATWISYHGANSPDLQCAQNEVERALERDARAITGVLLIK